MASDAQEPKSSSVDRPDAVVARKTLALANRFNGENRMEAVSFPEPGTYLVICNVNPHFRDGMYAYAYVKVTNWASR